MLTVATTLPSLARSFVMELPATQMFAPSKTRAPAPAVTEMVFKTAPSLARNLVTVLPAETHMLEPSNASADGEFEKGIDAFGVICQVPAQ